MTDKQAVAVAREINGDWDDVLRRYEFRKYPAAPYAAFRRAFSQRNPTNQQIEGAMMWKWGHSGKKAFPRAQKDFIAEIQRIWPQFADAKTSTADETFRWWRDFLNRSSAYISIAFITHLIHHADPFPIIDQHNFRAMNELLIENGLRTRAKKKPSNWDDIQDLKSFMQSVLGHMPQGRTFEELDRYLMMRGKLIKRRGISIRGSDI